MALRFGDAVRCGLVVDETSSRDGFALVAVLVSGLLKEVDTAVIVLSAAQDLYHYSAVLKTLGTPGPVIESRFAVICPLAATAACGPGDDAAAAVWQSLSSSARHLVAAPTPPARIVLVCDDVSAVADVCGDGLAALELLSALARSPWPLQAPRRPLASPAAAPCGTAGLPPLFAPPQVEPAAADPPAPPPSLRALLRVACGTDLALCRGSAAAAACEPVSLHGCLARLADTEWRLTDLASGRGGGVDGRLAFAAWGGGGAGDATPQLYCLANDVGLRLLPALR